MGTQSSTILQMHNPISQTPEQFQISPTSHPSINTVHQIDSTRHQSQQPSTKLIVQQEEFQQELNEIKFCSHIDKTIKNQNSQTFDDKESMKQCSFLMNTRSKPHPSSKQLKITKNQDNVHYRSDKMHDSDIDLIEESLRNHFIFSQFTIKERYNIIQKMKYCVALEDTYIFKKGEESFSFYVILEGVCVVEVNNFTCELRQKQCFGDLGLLHNTPRSASIYVKQACLLAAFDRSSFKKTVNILNVLHEDINLLVLRGIDFFSQFSETEQKYLASRSASLSYKKGETIFQEQSAAHNIYVVKSGLCYNEKTGKLFGPNNLIDENKIFQMGLSQRTYTLCAKSDCILLSINKCLLKNVIRNSTHCIEQKQEIRRYLREKQIMKQSKSCNWKRTVSEMIIMKFNKGSRLFRDDQTIQFPFLCILKYEVPIKTNSLSLRKIKSWEIFQDHQFPQPYIAKRNGYYGLLKLNEQNHEQTISYTLQNPRYDFIESQLFLIKNLHESSHSKLQAFYAPTYKTTFAIKIVDKERPFQLSQISPTREKEIFRKMGNQNCSYIVKCYSTIQKSNYLYLIQELLEGHNLASILDGNQQIVSAPTIKIILASLLSALQFLHQKMIVYRNLNLSNIMLTVEGSVKIIDFSQSTVLKIENSMRTSTIVGSPYYMAPEMLLGKGYGFQSDLWALGIVFYQLIFKRFPFGDSETSPMKIFQAITNRELIIPSTVEENIKELMKRLLRKSMQKRLGGGFEEIKQCSYLKNVRWNNLKIEPITLNSTEVALENDEPSLQESLDLETKQTLKELLKKQFY